MYRYFFCGLALLWLGPLQAQPLGNEWLVPGQAYYKMPVAKEGTYQLTWSHFQRAGIDVAQLDPRTIQLLHRGREQPLSVSGEADGRFDPGDILTFSGQGNDGLSDSALYRPAAAQPHTLYSLFSDTTYYFVTWKPTRRGLRQTPAPQQPVQLAESRLILHTDYPAGAIYPLGAGLSNGSVLSHYDAGEGWTGPAITKGQFYSAVVPMSGVAWSDARLPVLEGWAVGRGAGVQRLVWWVNGYRLGESSLTNYETAHLSLDLPAALLLEKPRALTIVLEPQTEGARCSLSALRLKYWQLSTFAPAPRPAPELLPVSFRLFEVPRANYLIVTHPSLRKGATIDPVQAYAAYRASPEGGSFDTLTVNITDLFDTFTYGERSPLAIRRFARWVLQKQDAAPLLFLIGQSRDPQGVRHQPDAPLQDLLPNGGWPGSDALLVEGLHGENRDVPGLAVGRLNASQPRTVLDYLAKVQAYEASLEPQLWRKTLLHLSGGRSADEQGLFKVYLADLGRRAGQAPLGGRVLSRSKQTDAAVEAIPIDGLVNAGVGLITLFGHSGFDVADVDIGFATDDRRNYRNKGLYPFLLVNGCAAGNVFFGRPTFGTDWVTAAGRGAIGFLAHTYNGFPRQMQAFSSIFYELLSHPRWQDQAIGRIQQETVRRYLQQNKSEADVANAQQFLLQGDPAIRLFPFNTPDYAFGGQNELLPDGQAARVVITNAGRAEPGQLKVRLRQYRPAGELLAEQQVHIPAPLVADTLILPLPGPFGLAENRIFELRLNPDEQLSEYRFTNNTLVFGGKTTETLPFPPDNVPPRLEVVFDGKQLEQNEWVAPRPLISLRVRDENSRLLRRDTSGLLLFLQRPGAALTGATERLWWGRSQTRAAENGLSFQIDFQPEYPWPEGTYQLEAYASDLSGNRASPYRIGFRIAGVQSAISAGLAPNPFGGPFLQAHTRFSWTLTGAEPPATIYLLLTNTLGQPVRSLAFPGRIGTTEWSWNGTDDDGRALPAGLYLYTFKFPEAGWGKMVPAGRVLLIR